MATITRTFRIKARQIKVFDFEVEVTADALSLEEWQATNGYSVEGGFTEEELADDYSDYLAEFIEDEAVDTWDDEAVCNHVLSGRVCNWDDDWRVDSLEEST